ncbi:LacI family DNA-binding transcriptional regulator [Methylobrevis pamukkalensis]|uniref:HTH-type transcriptional regulator DegA n=1 Tax=Methylobrevis pamukkalensis TaxID=1439726 RepID=A0A1E3H2T4_9HYPH|nr:LacI family DNA-binding transcriptional regulator [Methylobrevis pamukkalensis]ODN70465.1 HTH-type transcriptional regulator DegA [Methylobrevis pamukkalensis]
MGKPTVHDIALEAGVSLATVDRVLNGRPGVRQKTQDRVQSAILSLGYVRDLSAANLARQRQYRFVFVLPEGPGQFVASLHSALREAMEVQRADRIDVRILAVPPHDPHQVVRALGTIDPGEVDGIAIMAQETPQVRDAIDRLAAAGLAVVTLVSDLPDSDRDHFVGINNIAAGRTAALLMGRFLAPATGKVLVVTSSLLARDSLERRFGFDAVMAYEFPEVDVLPTLEARDEPGRMAAIVSAALVAHPDIVGIYSVGSGNKALLEALRRIGRPAGLVVIAHELTPHTRAALETGEIAAVITQDVGHLVRSAVRLLRAKCDGLSIIQSQERIRIEVLLRENLP